MRKATTANDWSLCKIRDISEEPHSVEKAMRDGAETEFTWLPPRAAATTGSSKRHRGLLLWRLQKDLGPPELRFKFVTSRIER